MRKLRLIVIILLITLFFVACTKGKKNEELTQADSLNASLTESNLTKSDSVENDPIWNESEDSKESADSLEVYQDTTKLVTKDDWIYGTDHETEELSFGSGVAGANTTGKRIVRGLATTKSFDASSASLSGEQVNLSSRLSNDDALGFSVGGAKDINNFRENIKNNYMPVEEDITQEGIFYDYFFDNNITKKATHLFEPAYTTYKNNHPLTGEEELYLSVGLNSNITKSSFERKKLNLTIVLDISGSMSSSFDKYYYDGGIRKEREGEYDSRSKMEIAKECIIELTKHLEKDDRFAVVLYNHSSYIAKPFNLVGKTDMDAIRNHIDEIHPQGGTNMYAGINTATELYDKLPDYDSKVYDNRIIFLTDAMPNTSITDENTLWGMMKANAENKIYTSFIGVGVDLNNELINYITKTPGANYYSVHSAKEFKKRMNTQFDFMVTPLVFDLTLHLKSDSYEIEKVYGSPEADKSTGEIMRVNTLFPSESEDGQTRGGIILIKLNKIGLSNDIELTCSYKDRNGIPEFVQEDIVFSKTTRGSDNGIRKAILLSRYVNLMHNWINDGLDESDGDNQGQDDWQYNNSRPRHIRKPRSKWERMSKKLSVSPLYKEKFSSFQEHFAKEATDIEDEDLRQELDILDILTK